MLKLLEAATKSKAKPRSKKTSVPREHQIAEAAYYLAEKRGFEPGRELDDWFLAENMVDAGTQRGRRG